MSSYYETGIESVNYTLVLPDKTTLDLLVLDGCAACSESDLKKLKKFPEESFVSMEDEGRPINIRLQEVYRKFRIAKY